ncbi:MAG: TonB family protein [Candidatus Aegiribacteria sp.]|nr:TonB family protein [Candidatus Aegiribacteria sp.]
MGSGAEKVKKLLQAARMQIQQGERKEALETYRKALKIDPENHQIMDRINIVEREIAAMEKFNKSRFSRAHTAGRNISSSGFVDDCIKRSDEAFDADDAVRALQELERANRHDPDNVLVKNKIAIVRRSIKVDGIADLVQSRLKAGDPKFALENIRRIFDLWPGAPVLDELLDMVEDYKGVADDVIVTAVPTVEKVEDKKEKLVTAPPATTPARTPTPYRKKKETKKPEKKREKKKKPVAATGGKAGGGGQKKIFAIIGIVVVLLVIVFVAMKFLGGKEPEPEVIEAVPAQPFTETIVVQGALDISMTLDGVSVDEGLEGVFILSDTIFTERTVIVSAPGFENHIWNTVFEEGLIRTDTLVLDSIGTSVVQVIFGYEMSEGEDDPGLEAISFMVDGEVIEGHTDSITTGEHIFQAILVGYRTMPESVLVVNPVDLNQTMNILASEQSQITMQLAADTPGNAIFFIDGERVATGRRMTQVMPFGRYFLQVQMEGRQDFGVTITLGEDGYSRTVSLEEIAETGQLMVGPEPWSNVYVDGQLVGTTPFGGVELEPGTYSVRLSNPDFQDDMRTVEITAGETTSIQYNAVAVEIPDEVHVDTATVVEPVEDLPISSPFPIQQPLPVTPSQARARGDLHGYVTLSVVVGTDGSVQSVSIVSDPLGLGCGQAAADAVRNWVFSPAMQGDQPVEVTTNVSVRFDIE